MGIKLARTKEATVAGLVSFSYSSSFREMDEAQMTAAFGSAYDKRFAIRDDAHHIIVSVIWNEAGRISGIIASARDANHGLEKRMRKAMRANGYTFEGHYTREVAGQTATCFSYAYEVAGQPQAGDVVTIKCGRTFVSFYCYLNPKTQELSRKVFDDILASVRTL